MSNVSGQNEIESLMELRAQISRRSLRSCGRSRSTCACRTAIRDLAIWLTLVSLVMMVVTLSAPAGVHGQVTSHYECLYSVSRAKALPLEILQEHSFAWHLFERNLSTFPRLLLGLKHERTVTRAGLAASHRLAFREIPSYLTSDQVHTWLPSLSLSDR